MIQTEYRLVSVGVSVSVGPAYFPSKTCESKVQSMHEGCERHTKKKKVKPYLKLMASVHLNMDYGVSVLGSPIGYSGFMSRFEVQGNFLLLCSSSNFVGYSYVCYL